MGFVRSLSDIIKSSAAELGGKGYSLAILAKNGLRVPRGFVIVSDAFFAYLSHNNLTNRIEELIAGIDEGNFEDKSREIRKLVLTENLQQEISLDVESHLKRLKVQRVSIRSSAVSEDSAKGSFAGLHDTFLNVRAKSRTVLENVKRCWASLFNERAVIYRLKKGIPHLEGMAVLVQEMIPAEISGVTFTTHPMKQKNLLLEASYGIGDIIVSGRVEPDDYAVNRETLEIVEKKIGKKAKMSVASSEGLEVTEVGKKLVERQVLPDNTVLEIARTCLDVERIFGKPQDVEWCVCRNDLWLLQSRPIVKEHL